MTSKLLRNDYPSMPTSVCLSRSLLCLCGAKRLEIVEDGAQLDFHMFSSLVSVTQSNLCLSVGILPPSQFKNLPVTMRRAAQFIHDRDPDHDPDPDPDHDPNHLFFWLLIAIRLPLVGLSETLNGTCLDV